MRVLSRFLAACFVLLPAVVQAQGSIAGTVRDASGAVLPGVTVEASSPALIEKSRAVVTDGNGLYRVVDLRPGSYVMTFTLAGFNTIKREGIDVSGSGTTSINVAMNVGAIEETITVTGESPVVDVQNTTKQSVIDHEIIDALPSNRNQFGLGVLIPGVTTAGQDVGGLSGVGPAALNSHGTRTQDQRLTMNGVALSTMQGGGWGGGAVPNAAGVSEITIDNSAVSAELATGGVRINFIPKDGGNRFSGTMFAAYANERMQSRNVDDELLNAGLATPPSLISNWTVNPGVGGPFKRDKLWFYITAQGLRSDLYANQFENKNAYNPDVWVWEADTTKRAENHFLATDYQGRLTWQAAQKHKIGFLIDWQTNCRCPSGASSTRSPEAGWDSRFSLQRPTQVDWTSPVTDRLLFEASAIDRVERWGFMELGHGDGDLRHDPRMISVTELGTGPAGFPTNQGLVYRNQATYSNNWNHTFHYRVSASYITGTHALRVGFNDAQGLGRANTLSDYPVSYTFRNGVPESITLRATPYSDGVDVDHDLGLFVQDKWTLGRVTIGLGVRYDHFASSFPELSLGPTALVPTRNQQFPSTPNLSWHDVTPKTSFAWDVRGDGKTAVKVSLNKYLEGMGLSGLAATPSPVATIAADSSTTRRWNDLFYDIGDPRRGNFVPDCNLLDPAINGECDVLLNPNFGTVRNNTSFDPEILTGWGIRNSNWEFAASVQREIFPRVSLDVGYFRRWYNNFVAHDNLSVGPEDYDTFSIVAPSDPRLPGGGGHTVDGLMTLKTTSIGRPTNTFVTLVRSLPGSPTRTEHWNGFDVAASMRPRNGMVLQGGISTGKTSEDFCELREALPEFGPLNSNGARTADPIYALAPSCSYSTPFRTQAKAFGSYIVPKIDVQIGATWQNIPGPEISANLVAPNTFINPFLGRNLAGAASATFNLLERGSLYGERLNQLDMRIAKVLRVGATRASVGLDIFNALNGNAILTQSESYALPSANTPLGGSWLRPSTILQARFVKISAQFDF